MHKDTYTNAESEVVIETYLLILNLMQKVGTKPTKEQHGGTSRN